MVDDLTKLNIARREPTVDITSIPEKRPEDVVHAVAKLVVDAIPGINSIGGKALEALIAPSLCRRKDEWVQSIAFRLVELEMEGRLRVEDVVNDGRFVSAVMHALQSAMKTHQDEKLEALRNAVLHTALQTAPDDDLTHIFLNLVIPSIPSAPVGSAAAPDHEQMQSQRSGFPGDPVISFRLGLIASF